MAHIPVLQREIIFYLSPGRGENFIDATIDGGGHAFAILEQNAPKGRLLGIDLSQAAINSLKARIKNGPFENRINLVCNNFANLEKIIKENNLEPIHGIIADLGISSWHLEESGGGFSFLKDEPLDMRYGTSDLTAQQILNDYSEKELSEIFWNYGEEKFARQIAKNIVELRKIKPIITTFQLVEIVKKSTPGWYHHQRIHPATKIFQALRIAVNQEFDNLNKFLPQALNVLTPGGRLTVISFHSLEDRIIKNFFRQKYQQKIIKILTKKPVRPSPEEVGKNPRSRSAKLRAAIKK